MRAISSLLLGSAVAFALVGAIAMPKIRTHHDSTPDLKGRWKAVLTMPEEKGTKDEDKFAGMFAKLLLGMFGSIKLRMEAENAYTLTLMGIPLEGHYTVEGNKIRFKPERALGKTEAEWQKMAKDGKTKPGEGADQMMKPMIGFLSAAGDTISIRDDKDAKTDAIVFHRVLSVDEMKLAKTVSDAEAAFVGHWNGSMKLPPDKKPKDPAEQQMANAILNSLELDLHRDNTFTLDMMMEIGGKWAIEGNTLVLSPTSFMGMEDKPSDKTKKADKMVFQIAPDQSLSMKDPKDGSEVGFTKGPSGT